MGNVGLCSYCHWHKDVADMTTEEVVKQSIDNIKVYEPSEHASSRMFDIS